MKGGKGHLRRMGYFWKTQNGGKSFGIGLEKITVLLCHGFEKILRGVLRQHNRGALCVYKAVETRFDRRIARVHNILDDS